MATEKRLTEKHYNGEGYYMKCSGLCHFDGHCGNCDELEKLVDRLGEYEDKAEQAMEVKHGEWIMVIDENDCERIECPLCGEQFYDGDNDTFDKPWNYCPNCGADMSGDGNVADE